MEIVSFGVAVALNIIMNLLQEFAFYGIIKNMTTKLTKTKKIVMGILIPVIAVLLAFLTFCIVTMCTYSAVFLGRVLTHWDSSVTDYKIFPERTIEKSEQPYTYSKNINSSLGEITVNYSNKQKILDEFIESTDTTSF